MVNRKNFIRELREAAGLSRSALAAKLHCHENTIVKLEGGEEMRLSDTWVFKISDALGCHPADLWDGGPERLKPRERDIVEAFRGLSEAQQAAFHSGVLAVARPAAINGDIGHVTPKLKLGKRKPARSEG